MVLFCAAAGLEAAFSDDTAAGDLLDVALLCPEEALVPVLVFALVPALRAVPVPVTSVLLSRDD